ncbi:hypothetical protein AB0F11_29730 [Streptomyces sp. NPDC032472]|uniref:hypothetical protein n=1 Tax=Streptomyces sp. NPDC032472 TaxID=3155018 RepID=UPI0033DA9762
MVQIERLAGLTPVGRRRAAALALWRWRAPVLAFAMDEEWGVDPAAPEELFRLAAGPPGEASDRAYARAVAELCTAPLFASEVDPDTVGLVQLEVIAALLAFGELSHEPGPDVAEGVVDAVSGLAAYLDGLMEDSFHDHPSQDAHRRYLADLPDLPNRPSDAGYFASRSHAVESACHNGLRALPDAGGLPDSSAGRALLALCEDFGGEAVTTLRWLRTTGY